MENRVLVIIPAYNEETNIAAVVGELGEKFPRLDYLVVNDGSRDRTAQICRENGYNLLDLPVNLGLAGCFQAGMKYAYLKGYRYAIQFDGDGQHDIRSLPALLAPIARGEADFTVGSRFVEKGASGFQSTFMRRLGISYLSFIIRLLTGEQVADVTSGYRAAGRKALE